MNNLVKKLTNKRSQRFFKYGAPFILLVVGGSFGLKEFTSLRYQFRKNVMLNPDELKKQGIEMKKPGEVTLETEYDKIKNLDFNKWENKRAPRPWEEETMNEVKK